MGTGIANGFVANPKYFISDNRVHVLHFAGYRKGSLNRAVESTLLNRTLKALREVVSLCGRRSQGIQRSAAFFSCAPEPVGQVFQRLPRSNWIRRFLQRIIRHQFAALDGLKQRIMEFPRHASSLCQPFVETHAHRVRNLSYTEPVDCPYQKYHAADAEGSKRACLIPRWSDAEGEACTVCVPDAVVVAGDHTKPIPSGREITVDGLPSRPWLLPVPVVTFQLVSKADLLGRGKGESRVIDFEIARQCGKAKIVVGKITLVVGKHLFNVHGRWDFISI